MFHTSTRLAIIASRFMVEAYYNGYKIPSTDLATEYNMNTRALMPALRKLTQAGILRSQIGGNEPGFIFAKDPKLISLYDVITILEGETRISKCTEVINGICCDVEDCNNCLFYQLTQKRIDNIKATFKNVTLFDHYESIKTEKAKIQNETNK